jgi:hypothetical protein
MDPRSPAEYADALRLSLARHRSGESTLREHLDRSAVIWAEVMGHGFIDQVLAEMAKGSGE